ncbi:MAG: fused MFS/spermidine synthase [Labilithrix sp.]
MSAGARRVDVAVTALLFVSGAAALIDEHVLSKLLARVVGSSAEAVACVLVAFMGGMGLGSALVGRQLEKARRSARPFLRYAVIEAAIGLGAVLVPAILTGVARAYASIATDSSAGLTVVRFVIAAGVVAVPAVLMGATLPLVLDAAARARGDFNLPLARFYAANTLGASAGVLGSTYILIPALGLHSTILASASCNLLAAGIAIALSRRIAATKAPSTTATEAAAGSEPPSDEGELNVLAFRRALLIAGGSGLFAFAYEVVSFRLLAVVVGNSVYAFGLMLFVFLLGNGIGSRLAEQVPKARPIHLVLAQGAVGLAALLTMPLWDDMSPLFQRVGQLAPVFWLWESTRFFVALVLLGPATVVMGMAFGFLLRIAAGPRADASARTARLYSVNMVGAIVGTLLTTFVVIPSFGSRATLAVISLGEIALACVALVPDIGERRRRIAIGGALGAAGLVLVLVGAPWNVATLMSGSNVYFSEGFTHYDRLVRLEEDRGGGMVAVVQTGSVKTLLANGKFEGNNGFEVADQHMYALFPLLFVKNHEAAVNIGVGTGTSLGVMGAFPFKHIDVVDISTGILDAAKTEFRDLNGAMLEDPRVDIHVDDGRNFLLRTKRKYDLIVMQLSSIWIGGTADLYNREFYDLAASTLSEDGVFQQWIQFNHMQTIDAARIIGTLRARFAHVQLWLAGHQGVLVASNKPLVADAKALSKWPSVPSIKHVVDTAKLDHPYAAFGHYQLGDETLDAFVEEIRLTEKASKSALLSTDDNVLLEYSTPRGNLLANAQAENIAYLRRHAEPSMMPLISGLDGDLDRRLFLAYAARERGFRRTSMAVIKPVEEQLRGTAHSKLVEAADATAKEDPFWP